MPVTNTTELKAEIARLKLLEYEKRTALLERVDNPSAVFHTVVSVFRGSSATANLSAKRDIFSMIARVLLPLTLNRTLFKKSNFLVKGLVTFLSQKASGLVNEDLVKRGLSKIIPFLHKKQEPKVEVIINRAELPQA